MSGKASAFDVAAIAACALIWGTTWYAITLQFGVVDPVISVCYRFGLAALILAAVAFVRKESLKLSRAQHWAALGVAICTFAGNYPLVYWAEERITSAIVAVAFAGHALCNLVLFRFALNERSPAQVWAGALMGGCGVALASWSELIDANMDARAQAGLALAIGAVVLAAFGNLFARRGEMAGASVIGSTAWAMFYGAGLTAIFATLSGRAWVFDARPSYIASLFYLSAFGSVTAFLLYFMLARRRGFAVASYVGALTPITAMIISALFEHKAFGVLAVAGLGAVLSGQYLMLRAKRG